MTQKNAKFLRETNFIGGKWIDFSKAPPLKVVNPSTGAQIGTVPDCGTEGANLAVAAAASAFPAWSGMTSAARAEKMLALAALIRANADELASLLTLEQGKPVAEAKGEVLGSAGYIQWFAEEARRIYGDTIPSPWPDRRIHVIKQAVGVVGAVTPWNFPSAMIARKLGAALGAGCTIVIKPSELTPYSGLAYGLLCEQAGISAGVVNIITGIAPPIGDVFCNNEDVAKITFTGSTAVGKKLASSASANMKRVSMELGGNAPFIVFDDADLAKAVSGAIASKFRNAGQTCVCANRIYVQAGIYDAFAKAFVAEVQKMKTGDGFADGVSIGPLIEAKAVTKVEAHIHDALAKGATLASGDEKVAKDSLFFKPVVLTDVTQDMLIANEETFGPVAPLFKFESEQEVIEKANATPFGLAAYFYTSDLARAHRVSEQLRYGQVGINAGVITTEVAPFGGVKDSGSGREGSKYGIEDYLDIKYICIGL